MASTCRVEKWLQKIGSNNNVKKILSKNRIKNSIIWKTSIDSLKMVAVIRIMKYISFDIFEELWFVNLWGIFPTKWKILRSYLLEWDLVATLAWHQKKGLGCSISKIILYKLRSQLFLLLQYTINLGWHRVVIQKFKFHDRWRIPKFKHTVFLQIVSSLEYFPPFNIFRSNYSIYEVKNCHNVETIWKFQHFLLSKKNNFRRNYSRKYGNLFLFYYRKVASSNTSCLEAHASFFQIAYEGDFLSLCTVIFWQKVDFLFSNSSKKS